MDVKLDFSDVLITPTVSNVESRRFVNLTRKFKFKYSPYDLECVPIMAANMDTVGTMNMMFELSKERVFTCLHKFVTLDEYRVNAYKMKGILNNFAITIGYRNIEIERLKVIKEFLNFKVICIDIANGHLEGFVSFCKYIRELYPEKITV